MYYLRFVIIYISAYKVLLATFDPTELFSVIIVKGLRNYYFIYNGGTAPPIIIAPIII